MVDNIKRYNEEAPRKCDGCSKGMWEGWCGGDGADYRCSDKCLFKDGYTKKLFREDLGYSKDLISLGWIEALEYVLVLTERERTQGDKIIC